MDNRDEVVEGTSIAEWIASIFGLDEASEKDETSKGLHDYAGNEVRLRSIAKEIAEEWPIPHVYVLYKAWYKKCVRETDFECLREEFFRSFPAKEAEILQSASDLIDSMSQIVADIRIAMAHRHMIFASNMTPAAIVQFSLGFDACRDVDEKDISAFVQKCAKVNGNVKNIRGVERKAKNKRRTRVKLDSYAKCNISSVAVYSRAPIGAFFHRAQGSTRSPKGHHAYG